jgi:hypothetical protein
LESYHPYLLPQEVSKTPTTLGTYGSLPKIRKGRFGFLKPLGVKNVMGLPNVCGSIDGTHILLSRRPSIHLTPVATDFFNRKKFHSVVLQGVCDINKIF